VCVAIRSLKVSIINDVFLSLVAHVRFFGSAYCLLKQLTTHSQTHIDDAAQRHLNECHLFQFNIIRQVGNK